MSVLLFGVSGATSNIFVVEANPRGYEVVAFIGGAPRAAGFAAQQIVRGDASLPNDVEAAIGRGRDVVVQSLTVNAT